MAGRQFRRSETASPPHTVSLENIVTRHGEPAAFTVETRLSEELGMIYLALRDHAFGATGGQVKKAEPTDKPGNIPRRARCNRTGTGT